MKRRTNYGWWELVIGILLVLLGIFTYFSPETLLNWVVVIYGIIAVLTGIADIVFFVRSSRFTGVGPILSLVMGIFSIMVGFMLMVFPSSGSWVMVLLLPIWFIAHCISRLCHLDEIRMRSGKFFYYFSMVINILGIILGVVMIFSPRIAYIATGFIIGTYFVLIGIDMIVISVSNLSSKNKYDDRWNY